MVEGGEKTMKRLTKILAGLSVLAVLMVCMTAVSFAGTAEDKVTVKFRAAIPGSVDCIDEKLEVTGNLVEQYFPDIAEYDVAEGVSFADAVVAEHIKKYGEDKVKENLGMSYNASWGAVAMDKQFGHAYVGFYYLNKASIPVVATSQQIVDGDELFAGSYIDETQTDLYSEFDADTIKMPVGATTNLELSCDNWGVKVTPSSASLKFVNIETGVLSDVPGAQYNNGEFSFSIQDKGVYYLTAIGSVTYDTSWAGEVTAQFTGALVKVVVAPTDEVTVDFKAGLAGSFDYIDSKLKVKGNLFEEYFPESAAEDTVDGVSFADAMVAAHIKKYGEAKVTDYMGFSGWMSKQFGHDLVGFYTDNNELCSVVANQYAIKNGAKLFAGAYTDNTWADLYSYFNKNAVNTTTGKNVTLTLKCNNWGTAVNPATAAAVTVNNKTGKLTAISGSKYANGKLTFKFSKKGTYYVSATGTVKSGETTGKFAGAYAKVVVKDAVPAKPVIKSAKRTTKKKATVVWKKAKNAKKYKVAYKKAGAKKWTYKTTSKTKIVLKKLNAKKKYKVKVMAINGSAKSKYSKVKTIKIKK